MSATHEYPAGVATAAMLLRMREFDRVVKQLRAEFMPLAESEVEIAVDRAFEEIHARGELVEDARRFYGAWVGTARNRCKDAILAPRHTRRLVEPPDEHDEALERVGPDEDAREREAWAMEEFLHALSADERRLLVALRDAREDRRQPRFINPVLGWGDERRKYIHKKLRASFTAFITRRENGELCEQQEQLIDVYVRWAWAADQPPLWLPRPSDDELVGAWLHLQACESCRYRVRAIDHATHQLDALIPPAGLIAGAVATAKSALAGAKLKATTTLPLLGGGRGGAAGVGGSSGAAGGLLTGVGGKVAACGIAAACLGGASTFAVSVGAPSAPHRAPPAVAAHAAPRQARPSTAVATAESPTEHMAPPDTTPTTTGGKTATRSRSSAGARPPSPRGGAGSTPGDLGVWMTPDRSTPRATEATTRAAPARQPSPSPGAGSQGCTTPGDLGC